jgi:hypothetical protein
MTSADPMVPDPMNGQAWNRYSYVVNNPLAFTDPSGYCFLGLCGVGNFFTNIGKDIRSFLQRVPIVGTILEVAAAAICPAVLVCAVTAAFLSTTAVSGIETGKLGLGLRAGLIAAATAVAFFEVGEFTGHQPQFGTPQYAENVAGHALVGCGQAVASGGKCGPSALAGGVTSAAGPVINGNGFFFGLVANTALGGGAAVLGGGKFENGAITSAFGYLFNAAAPCGVTQSGCPAATPYNSGRAEPSSFLEDAALLLSGVGPLARGVWALGDAILDRTLLGIAEIGAAGEAAVGVNAPRVAIQIPGTTTIRYPDILTDTTLEEVKNVGRLAFTQQLQDYFLYAQENNLTFIVWMRPSTVLTGTMRDLIATGQIVPRFIPGAR